MNGSCHYSTMPKNYKQGALYDIRCNQTGRVYVGSRGTTEEERMTAHTNDLVKYRRTGIITIHSSLVLESNDYVVNTIELYPCECDVDVCTSVECKRRLEKKEGEYIRQYKEKFGELCVNVARPALTDEERKEYKAQWQVKDVKENKEKYRKRREKDREASSVRAKQWHIDNPHGREDLKKPIPCELCGMMTSKNHRTRHQRTARCKQIQSEKNNI